MGCRRGKREPGTLARVAARGWETGPLAPPPHSVRLARIQLDPRRAGYPPDGLLRPR